MHHTEVDLQIQLLYFFIPAERNITRTNLFQFKIHNLTVGLTKSGKNYEIAF